MMLRFVAVLALVVSLGCGNEYEEECAAFCPEGDAACPQGPVNCIKSCAEQAEAAEAQGCRSQSVAYSQCLAAEDICAVEAPEPCQDEYGALYDCLAQAAGQGGGG